MNIFLLFSTTFKYINGSYFLMFFFLWKSFGRLSIRMQKNMFIVSNFKMWYYKKYSFFKIIKHGWFFLSGKYNCDFLCLGESFPRSALKKLENLRSLRIWELLQEKVTYNQRWALPIEFRYSDILIPIGLSNSYQNIGLTYLSDFNYWTSYIGLLIVR